MRLDKRLKAEHPALSWRQVREAIEKGQVTVDGRGQRDPGLDVYDEAAVDLNLNRPAQSRARASFDILHEDDEIIVLNKPAGLLSMRMSTCRPAGQCAWATTPRPPRWVSVR